MMNESKTNWDSEKFRIAKELDDTKMSKAAIKEAIPGHPDVLKAKKVYDQCKTEVTIIEAELKYAKMAYDAGKKYFDGEARSLEF